MGARSGLFLFLSWVAGLSALLIDLLVLGTPLLAEGPPEFTPLHLVRTVLMAACGALFIAAVTRGRQPPRPEAAPPFARAATWTTLSVSLLFLLCFVYEPQWFYFLARENHPVELLSPVLGLAACAVFLRVARIVRGTPPRSTYSLGSVLLALCSFVIAMEEVSWLQGFLAFESPAPFQSNEQGEVNLHNFATDEVENAYGFALFVLLIVAPFVSAKTTLFRRFPLVSFFVPGRTIAYASVMAFAYNYDMWNVLATQLTFFVPLFILLGDCWHGERLVVGQGTLVCLTGAYLLTQAVFLVYGERLVQIWDVTEYKELLLALSFLFYALELLHRARLRERAVGEGVFP